MRLSTWGIRDSWWPFGNVSVGGRHIHHFVPGILLAFASGTAALLTDNDALEDRLAIPMGAGMGLTFDEAALLLDLRDVYWTREGLLSVQLSLGATAILSIAILTQRMLRRGEQRQEAAGEIPPADDHLTASRRHLGLQPQSWVISAAIAPMRAASNRLENWNIWRYSASNRWSIRSKRSSILLEALVDLARSACRPCRNASFISLAERAYRLASTRIEAVVHAQGAVRRPCR